MDLLCSLGWPLICEPSVLASQWWNTIVYSYPAFLIILRISLFCLIWFFFWDRHIHTYMCVYICMYMCVYLNIYPDNPPASASRVLDYRCCTTTTTYSRGFKKMYWFIHWPPFFKLPSPKQKLTLQTEAEMSQISDVSWELAALIG